jgi:hypothetical protein
MMVDFSYRISCLISVPSEELLAHAFHYEVDKFSINETFNRPEAGKLLADGKTMQELFEPMIQEYANEFGLQRDQIHVTKYLVTSGNKDVVASFWVGGAEQKFETTDPNAQAIAYYHENQNLGYGLELYEYISKLPDNTFALRVGEQVPEGDVNLAFVHTPRLNSDENISFIDTAYVNENVIPMDQMESIVVPDQNGVLSYADIISDDQPIIKRPPYDQFPSKDVNITRRFMRNELSVDNALFYKFELKYHYDSDPGEPGKVVRYTGSQIQITDEEGNPLGPEYKYMIYVMAMEQNPKIYWVKIYLQMNTDEERTFKVRYNHVETVAADDLLHSVTKTVELYSNKDNAFMIEGGKLRIINGVSAYEPASLEQVKNASPLQEIYSIEEHPDKDGYKITVPQKSEIDPRAKKMFNYKLSAKFEDDKGENRTITFGYVTDWVINPEALLDHEKLDYTNEWKTIGLRTGAGFFSAKQLIQMVLPMDMPALPEDAVFEITDAQGNLLYTATNAPDNGEVVTSVAADGGNPPQAKVASLNGGEWVGAKGSNVRIKNNPIPHLCTIFPERQKTDFDFSWEASGEGIIETQLQYNSKYKVCQDIVVVKENTTKMIDVFSSWDYIGTADTRGKWRYDSSTDILLLTANAIELSGYYDGSATSKKDYKFSACVRITDTSDDDVIGILFRVRDSQHFYCFLWEKDQMMTQPDPVTGNGVGRIMISEKGISAVLYNSTSTNKFNETNDYSWYLNYPETFQSRKKRIFKVSPNTGTRYAADQTGLSFQDITSYTYYNPKGWERDVQYKITVWVTGNHFQVYIGNDTSPDAKGQLVCEAYDSTYSTGAYGLANISQKDALWSKLTYTELESSTVCSDWFPVTLTSNAEVKVSDKTADSILQPLVDDYIQRTYGSDFKCEKHSPYPTPGSSDLNVRIRSDGYVWAQTNSYQAGGIQRTPWRTSDHGKNIKGTGKAFLRADGTMGYTCTPTSLSKDDIPSEVKNFSWNRIWLTSGDSSIVHLSLGAGDEVVVQANVPPILPIGTPYTIPQDMIFKHEGMKTLASLFGDGGIYNHLGIPSDVPKEEILLRIERGDINGNNKEYRVNYRWHYTLGDIEKFEVDQMYQGVNRMRFSNILKPDHSGFLDGIQVNLVAWTNFEDLEAVPILALKIDDNRKIEVEKPKVEQRNMEIDNWYIRVKNGRVKRRLRLPYYEAEEKIPQLYVAYPELVAYAPRTPDQIVEVILDYNIPEYVNQEFYNRPIMLVDREFPVILDEKTIQTRFAPLVLQSESGISYLEVEALRINNSRKLRISDVDAKKGIIYLHDKIRDQDEVIVRYAYREDWYTYRGFERINPTTNQTEFFHLDFNPSPGHKYTVAKMGFQEWIPGDIFVSKTYTEEERPTNELLVKQIHVYLRPTAIWIEKNGKLQLIEGTVRNQSIYHTDEDHWFDPDDYYYDPTMLRLGKFQVQANSTMQKDMIILDTRSRGGGLDEALSREIIAQVNKESLYHWDIGYFDGEAYQENGVIIIRLPRSILKTPSNPDGFTETEIQAAIAKHKAYGVLPILEFYDPTPPDLNIIGNAEFSQGKHILQYNKVKSSGLYVIDNSNLGNGNDFVLKLMDDAKYVITIPGTMLKHTTYQIQIKAMLENDSSIRYAGYADIYYSAGPTERIQLGLVEDFEWMVYETNIQLKGTVDKINLTLNEMDGPLAGILYVDYVKMIPILETNDSMEVIEF